MPSQNLLTRLRLFPVGVLSTTGAPDFSFQSQVGDLPAMGGQLVRPAQGRTETQQWTIPIVDASSALTIHLATTAGRMNWLGRVAQFQKSTSAGSTWATVQTGRVLDLTLDPNVSVWRGNIRDERIVERDTENFGGKANTPTIIPPGPIASSPPRP